MMWSFLDPNRGFQMVGLVASYGQNGSLSHRHWGVK